MHCCPQKIFINASFEKDRSPVQLDTMRERNFFNPISVFVNVAPTSFSIMIWWMNCSILLQSSFFSSRKIWQKDWNWRSSSQNRNCSPSRRCIVATNSLHFLLSLLDEGWKNLQGIQSVRMSEQALRRCWRHAMPTDYQCTTLLKRIYEIKIA